MARPPVRDERIITGSTAWMLGALAVGIGAAALVAYLVGRRDDQATGQTMAFATVALAELALVFTLRSSIAAAWRAPANRLLVVAVIISVAVVIAAVQVPPMAEAVGCSPLGLEAWLVTGLLALLPGTAVEVVKAVRRRAARGETAVTP